MSPAFSSLENNKCMAVNESSGWWWFEISGYRWSKRRKTFVISLWARDGVSQPDSGISRKVPKSAKPPSWYPNYNMWLILWPRGCQHHIMSEPCSLHAFFFFLTWYTAHPQLPFMREHPTPVCGFYSKHMLRTFEVPARYPWAFFFLSFFTF